MKLEQLNRGSLPTGVFVSCRKNIKKMSFCPRFNVGLGWYLIGADAIMQLFWNFINCFGNGGFVKTRWLHKCGFGHIWYPLITPFGIDQNPITIQGFPVAFYLHLGSGEDVEKYRSRIRIPGIKKNHCRRHLLAKFDFLIWHLKMCHKQLIHVQTSEGMILLPDAIN
jgi:hypothetical protein